MPAQARLEQRSLRALHTEIQTAGMYKRATCSSSESNIPVDNVFEVRQRHVFFQTHERIYSWMRQKAAVLAP